MDYGSFVKPLVRKIRGQAVELRRVETKDVSPSAIPVRVIQRPAEFALDLILERSNTSLYFKSRNPVALELRRLVAYVLQGQQLPS